LHRAGRCAVACGQTRQGADREEGDGTGPEQAPTPAQKKATKAQKAPTLAQKKQQDRWGECNKQANRRFMKGEERRSS